MKQINKKIGLGFLILGLVSVPLSANAQTFQERVATQAIQEWQNFNTPPAIVNTQQDVDNLSRNPLEYSKCEVVNKYWRYGSPSLPSVNGENNTCKWPRVAYYCLDDNNRVPDKKPCKKREDIWDKEPWSAAFISYIMRESGAGGEFKYSASHSTYIIDAVKNRNSQNYPFRGYPIDSIRPTIGDLICAPRAEDQNLQYPQIKNRRSFKSHCDVVVAKNGNQLEVIGGNVGDSVAKTIVSLDANGHIKITEPSFRPWFVVIKNTLNLE